MTTLEIHIDGKQTRCWNFANAKEAETAESQVATFIQNHIDKETIVLFVWRSREE